MRKKAKDDAQEQLRLALDVASDKARDWIATTKEEISSLSVGENIGEKGAIADYKLSALSKLQGYIWLAISAMEEAQAIEGSDEGF